MHDVRTVRAQVRGEHRAVVQNRVVEGGAAAKRRKLDVAKKYKHLKPLQALAAMGRDGVPVGYRPDQRQLKEQRRSRPPGPALYPTHTIGTLRRFLDNPPASVHIFTDHVTLSPEEIRIPFCPSLVWHEAAAFSDFTCFLMDYTFDTNQHGLLLGVCGPCGLQIGTTTAQLPGVRFVPHVFCIARTEDGEAHTILLTLYEQLRSEVEGWQRLLMGSWNMRVWCLLQSILVTEECSCTVVCSM